MTKIQTSRILTITLIVSFILPNLAFASWWNPGTWFTKDQTVKLEDMKGVIGQQTANVTELATSTPAQSSGLQSQPQATNKTIEARDAEISSLKAIIVDLRKSLAATNLQCKQAVLEKPDVKPMAKPVNQKSSVSGSGSGWAGGGGSGVAGPLKCSNYAKEFATAPNCASYTDSSSGADSPLYKICKQCNPSDISQPLISDIKAINITGNSATIVWTTSELADSQVMYATAPMFQDVTPSPKPTMIFDRANSTSHNLNLSNLSSGTVYYYRVVSVRTSGNPAGSDERSFKTLAN